MLESRTIVERGWWILIDSLLRRIGRFTSRRPDRFQARKDYLRDVAARLERPRDDLLEGIGMIRWGDLQHAYGSATDVPDCLRIVAYGTPDDREDAQCELESNIFHQYTLYQATVFAVPFLLRMVSTPSIPDRPWLLDYLRSLAKASDHVYGAKPKDASSVREAVSVGLPAFRSMAASADEELRDAAQQLVGVCVETGVPPEWWKSTTWARGSS